MPFIMDNSNAKNGVSVSKEFTLSKFCEIFLTYHMLKKGLSIFNKSSR